MKEHYKLIVDIENERSYFEDINVAGEKTYFDDIEVAYEMAQIAVRDYFAEYPGEVVAPVSLWEWMAGALPPRWIEIPIEIEEEVN
jgi:hypothetical protein